MEKFKAILLENRLVCLMKEAESNNICFESCLLNARLDWEKIRQRILVDKCGQKAA